MSDGLRVEIAQSGPIPLDVSFECRKGQTVALVGPSGAGKTTVLRTIAGLYRPRSGRVVAGEKLWLDTATRVDRPPHERRVGLVFQSYALFPHLTARANVEIALGHVPIHERRTVADALLARVQLAGLELRKPAALSGGEQQRVALARALAREPEVFLLDEPLSAVDRRTRRRLREAVAGLRHSVSAPIILVTHDLDEAIGFADELVVIDRGKILQRGTPRSVIDAPVSEHVREILDLPAEG